MFVEWRTNTVAVVTNRYRSTPSYHRVFSELITAARYRGTVTYQEVAVVMGIETLGVRMGTETGHILGEISEDEHDQGRPMLSAVAVSVDGSPGDGFYGLAVKLGRLTDDADKKTRLAFWRRECKAAYETWTQKFGAGP